MAAARIVRAQDPMGVILMRRCHPSKPASKSPRAVAWTSSTCGRWRRGCMAMCSIGTTGVCTVRPILPPATFPRALPIASVVAPQAVRPYIDVFTTVFPEGAGYQHDDLDRRTELTAEQRPVEPTKRRFASRLHRQRPSRLRVVRHAASGPGVVHRSRRRERRQAAAADDDAGRLRQRNRSGQEDAASFLCRRRTRWTR